jgi:MFS family permease
VPWLLADRVALGAVEGVVLPAMLVFLTRWFTRGERSRANSLLMLANPLTMMWASAASGYIIEHFEKHPALGMEGWQMMFIVEGVPSIAWAGFWLWLSRERPGDAEWLAPHEAQQVQEKLDAEQSGIKQVHHYLNAFADARVVLLSLMFVCFCAAGYAFMTWMPKIVEQNIGKGIGLTGLLMSIPYLVACFSVVGVSWISDRTLHRKRFVWGSHVVGAIGYFLAAAIGHHHFGLAFVALVVVGSTTYTPTSPMWAWMTEMLPRNVVAESMALVNSAGALGGFLGVYLGGRIGAIHPDDPTPTFVFCGACLVVAAILGLCVRNVIAH